MSQKFKHLLHSFTSVVAAGLERFSAVTNFIHVNDKPITTWSFASKARRSGSFRQVCAYDAHSESSDDYGEQEAFTERLHHVGSSAGEHLHRVGAKFDGSQPGQPSGCHGHDQETGKAGCKNHVVDWKWNFFDSAGTREKSRVVDSMSSASLFVLQALTGMKDASSTAANQVPNSQQQQSQSNKKPKTIHRCILQRVSRGKSGPQSSLKCHVCDSSYATYDRYLEHLLDSTCAKKKEEKEAAGRNGQVPIIVKEVNNAEKRGNRPLLKKSRSVQQQQQGRKFASNGNSPSQGLYLSCEDQISIEHEGQVAVRTNAKAYRRHLSEPLVIAHHRQLAAAAAASSASMRVVPRQESIAADGKSNPILPSPPIDVQSDARHSYVRSAAAVPASTSMANNNNDAGAVILLDRSRCSDEDEAPLNLSVTNSSNSEDASTDSMPALLPIRKRREAAISESRHQPPPISPIKRMKMTCAHKAALTLPPLSLVEHAADQAKLANLKVQLTNLMVSLLGEARLTEMGYPEKDILILLKSVLEAARAPIESRQECGEDCANKGNDDATTSAAQIKFRELRIEIRAAKKNVRRLLEICVPDSGAWSRRGWEGKDVEDILQDVSERGMGSQTTTSRENGRG